MSKRSHNNRLHIQAKQTNLNLLCMAVDTVFITEIGIAWLCVIIMLITVQKKKAYLGVCLALVFS